MEKLKTDTYQLISSNKEEPNSKKIKIELSYQDMANLENLKSGKERKRFKRFNYLI